jgi:hypothetical protein
VEDVVGLVVENMGIFHLKSEFLWESITKRLIISL